MTPTLPKRVILPIPLRCSQTVKSKTHYAFHACKYDPTETPCGTCGKRFCGFHMPRHKHE